MGSGPRPAARVLTEPAASTQLNCGGSSDRGRLGLGLPRWAPGVRTDPLRRRRLGTSTTGSRAESQGQGGREAVSESDRVDMAAHVLCQPTRQALHSCRGRCRAPSPAGRHSPAAARPPEGPLPSRSVGRSGGPRGDGCICRASVMWFVTPFAFDGWGVPTKFVSFTCDERVRCSSAGPVAPPRGWGATRGWRRGTYGGWTTRPCRSSTPGTTPRRLFSSRFHFKLPSLALFQSARRMRAFTRRCGFSRRMRRSSAMNEVLLLHCTPDLSVAKSVGSSANKHA